MPVSVAIGCDPATIYASTAPLPKTIDELFFAGFLRRWPVPVVKSITNDILIPANSEFVLEGYVDTEKLREEGPFGDHTGFYSEQAPYPVFHIQKMTRRKNPVYIATVVGRPPMEDCYLAKATERLFLPLLRIVVPEIIEINFPAEGVFHNCVIVSIDKRYPGQARKVMYALWGTGQMMYTKMIIVVDKWVNPHDLSAVAWRVFNNIDARRDLVITEGPLDALDHASPLRHIGGRLGIDATKKLPGEGYDRPWPDEIEMDASTRAMVDRRWAEYGL
jgi:4-hydroxy-3-polyprenylbenzoate decarboxylase